MLPQRPNEEAGLKTGDRVAEPLAYAQETNAETNSVYSSLCLPWNNTVTALIINDEESLYLFIYLFTLPFFVFLREAFL